MDHGDRSAPVRVRLDGVPETTMCTLWYRATEARSGRGGFADPRALDLVATIDYPFEERFGGAADPSVRLGAQFVGQRARTFDAAVAGALRAGAGTVVALGEGLETQFWRVDDGRVRWLTVDLPETAAVRAATLGEDPPRRRIHAGSALDADWPDLVGDAPGEPVVVVAQGLLMYLPPPGVRRLLVRCAQRFRRGMLLYDTVPHWFAGLATRGRLRSPTGYRAPAMPWPQPGGRLEHIRALHPDIVGARALVPPPDGQSPALHAWSAVVHGVPALQAVHPSVVRLDFR